MRKFLVSLLLVITTLNIFSVAYAAGEAQGNATVETLQVPLTPGAGDVNIQWSDTGLGRNWVAGPVTIVETWDAIDPNAPKTIFNIQTTKINPNIF